MYTPRETGALFFGIGMNGKKNTSAIVIPVKENGKISKLIPRNLAVFHRNKEKFGANPLQWPIHRVTILINRMDGFTQSNPHCF